MKRISVLVCAVLMLASGTKKEETVLSPEEIYREVLSKYLVETLDLTFYDEKLLESEMNYIAVTATI